ncbi:phage recombination protein Bet [Marinobacterium aestuariivivens]|uniref:Phage recombination protein Bet n=1 Tax=Marinobacterium aestuariivivens TaxID=1698799 RepID=A0ABW2A9W9_9GAMM
MADSKSLVTRIASRYGVDSNKFFETLKATAFKQRDGSAPSNEQMMALLVVAEQYNLNPFTREIYAFPDKQNGIIPVVGVDGWSRIINEHSQYDGVEFVYSDSMVKMKSAKVECPEWIETVMYRKDRSRPIKIREFLDEVYREPFKGHGSNGPYTVDGPWQTHTKRQLRHKSLIQCARVAFGFCGIYDQDEAERIREMEQAAAINPAVASLTHVKEEASRQPLQIDHQKMDPILQKLATRAVQANAWSAAHQYAEERFKGAELEYATQFLRDRELDAMEPPEPNYGNQDAEGQGNATFIPAEGHRNAAEEPPLPGENDFFGDEGEGEQL